MFADASYLGVTKRVETQGIEAHWQLAMRPGKRKALDKAPQWHTLFAQNDLQMVRKRVF